MSSTCTDFAFEKKILLHTNDRSKQSLTRKEFKKLYEDTYYSLYEDPPDDDSDSDSYDYD
jgi:hypothetical protein